MRRTAVTGSVAAVGVALSLITTSPATAKRTANDDLPRVTVTAATYNVCKTTCSDTYSWARRRQAVVRTVAAAAPDILAVQEAPTLPWRGTTQWADLTGLLAGVGYEQTSDEDGCTDACTRGAHLYFNPRQLRVHSMPRPSGQTPPPAPCLPYLNDPDLPQDRSGPQFRVWRQYGCRDFLGYSATVDIATGMASQKELTGIAWGPVQDRNISWAYLEDIATGAVMLAVSLHLPNEKTRKGEQIRQAVATEVPRWIDALNADHGLSGVPVILMGDLNSYASRQPRGAQWLLEQAGFGDVFAAPRRINAHVGTVNYTPRIRRWNGFPPAPFRYSKEPSRVDYLFTANKVVPLVHEVVLHLRGGNFDPAYRGSDHNMVRAELSVPIVKG